jgi:uncharacterized protein (TIRG00374 family)
LGAFPLDPLFLPFDASMPETSPSQDTAAPGRLWLVRAAKLLVALLTIWATWHFFAHSEVHWSDLEYQVAAADPGFLALAVACLLARFAIWDWRFRIACRRSLGQASGIFLGFFVLMASAALNLITPTARVIGGLMRARYFARSSGRSFGQLFGVVLYDQIAHHAVFIVCTWIAVVMMAFHVDKPAVGIAGGVALIAVVVALWLWSRRKGSGSNPLIRLLARRAERSDGRMQQMYSHGHEAVGLFVQLLSDRPMGVWSAVIGTLYFLVQALAQHWIFLALGVPVELSITIAGVAVGNAAGTLSGTPGGAGATELAMVPSFVAMGLAPEVATAGTLVFRGLHYALVLAVGLPSLAVLELRRRRAAGVPDP